MNIKRTSAVLMVLMISIFSAPTPANACVDCWPDPPEYYTELMMKPSNWVTVGHYQPGDVVFKSIPSGTWYVVPGSEHDLQAPFPACCSDGPYFVSNSGGLFFVW